MENLSPRDKHRGTGRTTSQVLAAIEHAKATNKDETRTPIAYFIVLNRFGAEHLFHLLNRLGKEPKFSRARGDIIVDGVRIIIRSACEKHFSSMRGGREPIYIDHAVHEHGFGSEQVRQEFYAMFLHRIVNP